MNLFQEIQGNRFWPNVRKIPLKPGSSSMGQANVSIVTRRAQGRTLPRGIQAADRVGWIGPLLGLLIWGFPDVIRFP